MKRVILSVVLWGVSAAAAVPEATVKLTIAQAQRNALDLVRDGDHWDMPSYLGTHYVSQYYVMLRWLGREAGALDTAELKRRLLATQLPDGSWQQVRDRNSGLGDLSATIFDYWALKAMGTSLDEEPMRRARAYILARGGLARANLFTKIFLALFDNWTWKIVPRIPFVFFNESMPINHRRFAQWVGPHLMAIAYLRMYQVRRSPGPELRLDELGGTRDTMAEPAVTPSAGTTALVERLLASQQPRGTWGGYVPSTLLTIAAFEDFRRRVGSHGAEIVSAEERGYAAVARLHLQSGDSSYLGVLDDGRFWDTALILNALRDSGHASPLLGRAGSFIAKSQQPNGGIPFGEDFWYAPDTDDTALSVLAMLPGGKLGPECDRALAWLEEMQNDDGGWGAFDKNNRPSALLNVAVKGFEDSVNLYDESSADVTGHILEAMGAAGRGGTPAVRRALAYLARHQEADGSWRGRWGINYVYGTGAAVTGVLRVGVPAGDARVQRALAWLVSKQNADGGFGEAAASYLDKSKAGVGISTPTQTAWALLALVAGLGKTHPATERAVQYLVSEFERHGKWVDATAVGTGQAGIVYMEYPSYPYAFPLMALGRYARE